MELVVRATVVYWFLWLVVRGTGKRSLAEITPLELIMVVVLGDFVQQGVTEEDMSVTGALTAVSTFVMWMLVGDFVGRRWQSSGKILDGESVVVVRDGQPVIERLRRERLTVDDVLGAARGQGFGSLNEVAFGVLEHDGSFSFVPRGHLGEGSPARLRADDTSME